MHTHTHTGDVMVIVAGNGHSHSSSNPREKYDKLFSPQQKVNSKADLAL